MLILLYLVIVTAGVLSGFIARKFIKPKQWYILLVLAVGAFIVHGFIIDPDIGYPPWGDEDRSETLVGVELGARVVSWFSFGVIWGCIGAIAQLLRKQPKTE